MVKIPFFFFFSELKFRFFYIILSFFITFFTSYFYSEVLFYKLSLPLFKLGNFSLFSFIATNLSEIFISYIKISFFFSFYITLFLILFNIYFFIVPGLFLYEKKIIINNLRIFVILFILSICSTYFFIIPIIWKFFLSFEISSSYLNLQITPKINEYLNLNLKLFLIFSFCFQIPLILKLLLDFKILNIEGLISKRHFFIIFFFLFAGIISPPDIYSQIILALISIFFFEMSIFFQIFYTKIKKG